MTCEGASRDGSGYATDWIVSSELPRVKLHKLPVISRMMAYWAEAISSHTFQGFRASPAAMAEPAKTVCASWDQHPPERVVSTVVIGGQPSSSDPGWIGQVNKVVRVKVPDTTLVRFAIVSLDRYRVLSFFFMGASLTSLGGGLLFPQLLLNS